MNKKHNDILNDLSVSRRDLLKFMTAAEVVGILPHSAQASSPKIRTTAKIVIADAGATGLTCASRLAAALDGAEIILIDARKRHLYQSGFTLIGGGIKPMDYSISSTAEYMPHGVKWIEENVAEFDPDANKIMTDKGQNITYDYLMVTTGLQLEYGEIDGMSPTLSARTALPVSTTALKQQRQAGRLFPNLPHAADAAYLPARIRK